MLNSNKDYSKETEIILINTIVNYQARQPLSNVYSYIELYKRRKPIINDLQIISSLNKFAIEQGFEDWNDYLKSFLLSNNDVDLHFYSSIEESNYNNSEKEIHQSEVHVSPVIVTMGFIFSFLPLLVMPIIFMPIAIVFGLTCIFHKREESGVAIIIISIICGFVGAYFGGWGLGMPNFNI